MFADPKEGTSVLCCVKAASASLTSLRFGKTWLFKVEEDLVKLSAIGVFRETCANLSLHAFSARESRRLGFGILQMVLFAIRDWKVWWILWMRVAYTLSHTNICFSPLKIKHLWNQTSSFPYLLCISTRLNCKLEMSIKGVVTVHRRSNRSVSNLSISSITTLLSLCFKLAITAMESTAWTEICCLQPNLWVSKKVYTIFISETNRASFVSKEDEAK